MGSVVAVVVRSSGGVLLLDLHTHGVHLRLRPQHEGPGGEANDQPGGVLVGGVAIGRHPRGATATMGATTESSTSEHRLGN